MTGRLDAGAYWAADGEALLARLASSPHGLTAAEAQRRLEEIGPNAVESTARLTRFRVLLNQIRNPLLLVLVFASAASAYTAEWIDAFIVLLIVVGTVGIGYVREYHAQTAAEALRARVRSRARVVRDGQENSIAIEDVVPGDVVLLSAGTIVPADGVLLETEHFYVSEAVLTGESLPAQKTNEPVSPDAPLRERRNCVFLGTNVRSGAASMLAVTTGRRTEFGGVAHRLTLRPPETEFDRGIRRFSYLLTTTMLLMVFVVFVVHVMNGRPAVETLLFAVALAVGLSPELLPAILVVNLARGAQSMSRRGVLVRRLNAIENLGSMDVLCADKTGTLTEGVVKVEGAYDPDGATSSAVLRLAALNAAMARGVPNPLDAALLDELRPDVEGLHKIGEIPFDFVRKRLTVVVEAPGERHVITKGAFAQVLAVCTQLPDGAPIDDAVRKRLDARYQAWGAKGIRSLGVATRACAAAAEPSSSDVEHDLTFAGFVTFLDRPKEDALQAVNALRNSGVAVKIITGDATAVAQSVAAQVGLAPERVLTGADLHRLTDDALWQAAEHTDLFTEVDPNQKERIILALKKMGHVVGFLGDGVNDAPAMHAADTSLAVEQAVDVAREAADFVLLERGLDVIRRGIEEGRTTFANTLKYVLTTTSANLGNMISMAAASLVLPFLPLLASQILLNNFLSDIPAVGIAGDAVDHELVDRPRRWNMRFLTRYMVEFGALSSVFDFVTFGLLLTVFRASPEVFRTSWFIESLLTELMIALVVRTRRPCFRSRPGSVLLWSTIGLAALTPALPYVPGAFLVGLVPLTPSLVASVILITVVYVVAAEVLKAWFYRPSDGRGQKFVE